MIGTLVGDRYRVDRVIGEGGAGTVYQATHVELDREVALKVPRVVFGADSEIVERFLREARTASSFGLPNMVAVHDLGRLPDGRPYLVMPLQRGETLDDVLAREGPLPPARVVELLSGVAEALDVMHRRGLVHRDLKPDNLLLTQREDGADVVKVLDFGLATLAGSEGRRLTQTGLVVGTPHYIAPEVAHGKVGDARSDVYQLAVVAFELLTGEVPVDVDNGNVMAILMAKLAEPPRRLSDVSSLSFPQALEDALDRALSREPQRRPSTAPELIESLRQALAGTEEDPVAEDVEAGTAGIGLAETLRPGKRRRRWWVALALVLTAAAAVVLGIRYGALFGAETRAERDPAAGSEEGPRPAAAANAVDPPRATGEGVPQDGPRTPASVEAPDAPEPSPATRPAPAVSAPGRRQQPAPTRRPRPDDVEPGRPERAEAVPADSEAEGAPAAEAPVQPGPPAPPEADRDRAWRLSREGTSALVHGQLPRAVELFREAINAAPGHAAAWRGLGLAYERMGRRPEAVQAYDRYLRLAPSAADAASVRERMQALGG